jgi:glycosyltransferase involved in cell wall biosynthesis
MKILYACLDPGVPVGSAKGASIHVWEMIRALGQEGHETALVARRVVAAPATLAQISVIGSPPRGFRHAVLGPPMMRIDNHRVQRALTTAVKRFAPDLIYERYALGQTVAATVAQRHGVPHILEVNAPLAIERATVAGQQPNADAVALEHATWRGAHLVVVPSHPLADMVRAAGQERVVVTPNAVDPELFAAPSTEPHLRQELGLADRLVVGFVGTARPWHDLETLVAAMALVPEDLQATLLVVGEQPPADVLAEAARRGVEVVVTGPVLHSRVPAYLATIDVAVASLWSHPTMSYFSPLKALEYLAAGCPAVVADVGDLQRLADKNVAIPYHAGDPASLASAVTTVATDSKLRAQLRVAGREYAASWSWRAVAKAVIAAATNTIDLRDEALTKP